MARANSGQFGEAILIDMHSMPHEAVDSIAQAGARRPEIILGDRFGAGALTTLDAATLRSALAELPHAEVAAGTPVVQALVDTGLVASLSEARRAIAQGGVSLDGAKVEGEDAVVTGALPGGVSVLRRGKKTLAGLFVG